MQDQRIRIHKGIINFIKLHRRKSCHKIMKNVQKFKVEVILKSTPNKPRYEPRDKLAKYPKSTSINNDTIDRKTSLPSYDNSNNCIDLRAKIMNPKKCLARPSSQKEKESQLFTERCFQILSRKKQQSREHKPQKGKIQEMMNNIVEKYKFTAADSRVDLLRHRNRDSPMAEPRGMSVGNRPPSEEEKIEVYKIIKSTEISKGNSDSKSPNKSSPIKRESIDWMNKPDITGVRVNNLVKSQTHQIQGVTCMKLPISEVPMLKRHSMVTPSSATLQPRTFSSSSTRRKVSINRLNSNKFMAFSMNSDSDGLYIKKLKSFLDFIFKINYSNQIYISLQLLEDASDIRKYKVYVGRGNNSLLIKSLLKRRFWMEVVENIDEEGINFYWTQNKVNKVHYKQATSKGAKMLGSRNSGQLKRRNIKNNEQTIQMNKKILSENDCIKVEKFISKNGFTVPFEQNYECKIVSNHVPRNTAIGSKKNLFKSMLHYYRDYLKTDPFNYIPKTFNVKGPEDPEFKRFLRQHQRQADKVWIVKPGQNSNRGNGINLAPTTHVIDLIKKKQKHSNGETMTYIIQSYINKPFLYNGRKFDIRHYMLLTSVNGIMKAYWYKEGYLRTSSQKFDLEDLDNEIIHLTNDAIQKQYECYEKYQPGNKLSYAEFQRYLDMAHPNRGFNFERDIIPKMKSIILDVVKANYNVIDKNRRECNFQIFGFDFMLDRDFKPWLIEINFNPCLEMSCPLLSRIIPIMVENSLRIGMDPLLPPLSHYPANKRYTLSDNYLRNLKYQLIFDQSTFEETIPDNFDIQNSDEEEEEYCDEGKQIDQQLIL